IENKVDINDAKVSLYADLILKVSSENSYKEKIKNIRNISEEMLEKFDGEKLKSIPKVKQIICDAANKEESFNVSDLAEVMFYDQPIAKQEFIEATSRAGVGEKVQSEYVKASRSEQVQKIKTDKGIELIIPVDYMNSDYVEFIQNDDGTITINLKYINHIVSR
ncbi:MAG: nucleoid-associated protein, partial [Erysipelotrichaceae bacterium]